MTEGLREFDDSIGRCSHCNELVFKSDNDWGFSGFGMRGISHTKCEEAYMRRASEIGVPL